MQATVHTRTHTHTHTHTQIHAGPGQARRLCIRQRGRCLVLTKRGGVCVYSHTLTCFMMVRQCMQSCRSSNNTTRMSGLHTHTHTHMYLSHFCVLRVRCPRRQAVHMLSVEHDFDKPIHAISCLAAQMCPSQLCCTDYATAC